MKVRTKWFLGVLGVVTFVGSMVVGEPKILVIMAMLVFMVWLAWRAFVFLYLLLKPLREELNPIDAHLRKTLHQSGLGKVADFSDKVQSGLDRAVEATQQGIDQRKK